MSLVERTPELLFIPALMVGNFLGQQRDQAIRKIRPFGKLGDAVDQDRPFGIECRVVIVRIEFPATQAAADIRCRIPMAAGVDSLNVTVAASIALH